MVYEVVRGDTIASLNKLVNERLADGWRCAGGVAIVKLMDGTLFFFQSLTKEA